MTRSGPPIWIAAVFRRLSAPVYACFGNHEYIAGREGAEEFFADAGIRLLRDTALPVTEIAAAVGYDSSEHFIRTFRRYTGETPSGYRQRKQP